MMVLWHRTEAASATVIMKIGFQDGCGSYGTTRESSGVFLSDRPLDENEGACGDALLRVSLDCAEDEIGDFEWVEEDKPYREWQIPASFVNARSKVVLCELDERTLLAKMSMTERVRYVAWLERNPEPDRQELVRQYGTYPQIPQAAWEKFDRDREDWEARRRRYLDEQ
jgi:hypothetical protein